MSVVISNEVLQATQLSAEEFLHEVAILFYQQKRLTLAQAAALAQTDRLSFQQLLASRDIAIHYDEHDLETDIETLKTLADTAESDMSDYLSNLEDYEERLEREAGKA